MSSTSISSIKKQSKNLKILIMRILKQVILGQLLSLIEKAEPYEESMSESDKNDYKALKACYTILNKV